MPCGGESALGAAQSSIQTLILGLPVPERFVGGFVGRNDTWLIVQKDQCLTSEAVAS